MEHDEHEMLVEYSEMTAFNFNSKEYEEVKKDYEECKEAVSGFSWLVQRFISRFIPQGNY